MIGHGVLRLDDELLELDVRAEVVLVLGEPGEHAGYRVKYRPAGGRRWSAVLLVDHDHEPTPAELVAAIQFHRDGVLEAPA